MDQAELAKRIAVEAHAGQYRRDGVTVYISHPAAVADKVRKLGEKFEAVAWLHDVIEDTDWTADRLAAAGVDADVVEAVVLLTKGAGVGYWEYLCGIKRNKLACEVKIADMLHNISDDPTTMQIRKYAGGLLVLVDSE